MKLNIKYKLKKNYQKQHKQELRLVERELSSTISCEHACIQCQPYPFCTFGEILIICI